MGTEESLAFLRVQLFTAAQMLKGDMAEQFWKLVDDINSIRVVANPNAMVTDSNACERARLVQLMRTMMVDEYAHGWQGGDNVAQGHYIAGRNDVLRQLCKQLEAVK